MHKYNYSPTGEAGIGEVKQSHCNCVNSIVIYAAHKRHGTGQLYSGYVVCTLIAVYSLVGREYGALRVQFQYTLAIQDYNYYIQYM